MEQIVANAKDSDELVNKLYSVTKGASVDEFEVIMAKALYMADVMGYVHARQNK